VTVPQDDLLTVDDGARWEGALEGIRHGFGHTRDYCEAMASSSEAPIRLYTYRHGDDRFVCPVIERPFHGETDIATPIGFSGFAGHGDVPRFLQHWQAYARESGWVCGYIGLNPVAAPAELAGLPEYRSHNEIFTLDLRKPADELWRALSTNRKRQIKRFAEDGLVALADKALVRAFFLGNLDDFLHDRGASEAYRIADRTIELLLASEKTLALAVAPRGVVEAAMLLGYTPDCADYVFGASVGEGKRHSAALLWAGAMRLRDQGVPILNLGGGIRRGDGVAEFKVRFGADRLELGSLHQVYRPDDYARLCRFAESGGEDGSKFFPAYRAPAGARNDD
jgi:hypothetical protein